MARKRKIGTLVVAGCHVPVQVVSKMDDMGCYHIKKRRIQIKSGFDFSAFVSTICHELVHAAWHLYLGGVQSGEEELYAQIIGAVMAENYAHIPSLWSSYQQGADGEEEEVS